VSDRQWAFRIFSDSSGNARKYWEALDGINSSRSPMGPCLFDPVRNVVIGSRCRHRATGLGGELVVPLLGGISRCTYRLSAHFCDSDLLLAVPSKSTSLSRTQSIDLTSIQIEMYQSLISLLALAACVNAGTPHIIDVGKGGALTFSPDSLTAAVGDT
jgi:hypothetical protein